MKANIEIKEADPELKAADLKKADETVKDPELVIEEKGKEKGEEKGEENVEEKGEEKGEEKLEKENHEAELIKEEEKEDEIPPNMANLKIVPNSDGSIAIIDTI